ncbi:MAG: hypothetical protein ACTSXD_07110 [Candidatus Heimdallarchaeaceae archaeon]
MIQKDVQKKVLRSILNNGGSANTREISDDTGFKCMNIDRATDHLISRALVRKERPPKTFPRSPNIYHLNNKLLDKIKRLISEIEE